MSYKIFVTETAKEQLDSCVEYLIYQLCSPQAAKNFLDDYKCTIERLKDVAGSLSFLGDEGLRKFG